MRVHIYVAKDDVPVSRRFVARIEVKGKYLPVALHRATEALAREHAAEFYAKEHDRLNRNAKPAPQTRYWFLPEDQRHFITDAEGVPAEPCVEISEADYLAGTKPGETVEGESQVKTPSIEDMLG
jgi:hypothetical protein